MEQMLKGSSGGWTWAQLVLPDGPIRTLRDGACLWVGNRAADWTVSQQTSQCCPALVQDQSPGRGLGD